MHVLEQVLDTMDSKLYGNSEEVIGEWLMCVWLTIDAASFRASTCTMLA